MSDSPKQQAPPPKRKLPPRPRIKLPVPGQYTPRPYPHTPMSYVSNSYGQTPVPMTPISGQPTAVVYTNKANDFFTHLKGIKNWTKSGLSVGEKSAFWLYEKVSSWSKRWFTHIFLFFVLFLYSILGAFLFMYIERTNEREVKDEITVERDKLIRQMRELWFKPALANSTDNWMGAAKEQLIDYELKLKEFLKQLKYQFDPADDTWNIWNAIIYCCTVYTTIGYGHIYPNTKTGRALTIVYAIFGIPMFLIILADFGKMFTRGIKFLWAFVRRLYFTGSCRQMRRTVPMQEMMKGVQAVYDFATFRRPSQMTPEELVEIQRQQQQLLQQQPTSMSMDNNQQQQQPPESPSTPAMSTFEIDDEFNLPISVAITILVLYIFIGATAFNLIEDWGFFDSFYFVFISMSTIGFGDFVPNEPLWMMLSIVYLIFGLALTSMCINVVQVMLTDQFKQASQKIGATIGFQVSEEDGSLKPSPPEPVEVAEVHIGKSQNGEEVKEKVAPKVKMDEL